MSTPELYEYIRKRLAKNDSREAITSSLRDAGWRSEDIIEGFRVVGASPTHTPLLAKSIVTPITHTGRKVALSLGLIAASGIYTAWSLAMNEIETEKKQAPISLTPIAESPIQITAAVPVEQIPPPSVPVATSTQPPTAITIPTPEQKPASTYADGDYTGSAANAYYGLVQVKIAIQGDKITDVQFLQYPNDRRTSQQINSQAMPLLKQEALSIQSAAVQVISGATDTSLAFRESLASALAKAKN